MSEPLTGAALAEAVAVEVMGWRWFRAPNCDLIALFHPDPAERRMWAPSFSDVTEEQARYERFSDYRVEVPDYADDIAAAMQVVERMQALGWAAEFGSCAVTPGGSCGGYYAQFVRDGNYRDNEMRPTMPEAICRAALAAVRAAGGDSNA